MRKILLPLAAMGMVAAPVAASAAPIANPAASLSVANSARASTATTKDSDLLGAGLFATVIVAGIIAIVVIAVVNDSNDSDSN